MDELIEEKADELKVKHVEKEESFFNSYIFVVITGREVLVLCFKDGILYFEPKRKDLNFPDILLHWVPDINSLIQSWKSINLEVRYCNYDETIPDSENRFDVIKNKSKEFVYDSEEVNEFLDILISFKVKQFKDRIELYEED